MGRHSAVTSERACAIHQHRAAVALVNSTGGEGPLWLCRDCCGVLHELKRGRIRAAFARRRRRQAWR